MKVSSFIVFLKSGEMHFFDEREDYLAFVKDREDLALLYASAKTLFERLKELYEIDDALVWLDEIDSIEKDRVLDDMEYRDAKESLMDAYKNRDVE